MEYLNSYVIENQFLTNDKTGYTIFADTIRCTYNTYLDEFFIQSIDTQYKLDKNTNFNEFRFSDVNFDLTKEEPLDSEPIYRESWDD